MGDEKEITKTQPSQLVISDEVVDTYMKASNRLTEKFQEWLIKEVDFTTEIFGRGRKPTLLDPGAGKLIGFFQCRPRHRILERFYTKDEEGYESIRYVMATEIVHEETGRVVGEGVGSCTSDEVKYKYRWFYTSELRKMGYTDEDIKKLKTKMRGNSPVYRARNPEIPDLDNTILKMASKRSEVDGCLQLPGVAAVFTQDLGDYKKPEGKSKNGERKEVNAEQYEPPMERIALKSVTPAGVMNYLHMNIPSLNREDFDLKDVGDAVEVYTKKRIEQDDSVNVLVEAVGGKWITSEKGKKKSHWRIPKQDEPPAEEPEPAEEEEPPKGPPGSVDDVRERIASFLPGHLEMVVVSEYSDYYRVGKHIILDKEVEDQLDIIIKGMGGEWVNERNEWRIPKGS